MSRRTLEEIKDEVQERFGEDWRWVLGNKRTESEYRPLDEFDDEDEFYTDGTHYEPVDTATALIDYEDGLKYVYENGLLKEFKEYGFEQTLDACIRFRSEIRILPEEIEEALRLYIAEDVDDYLDWLWSK